VKEKKGPFACGVSCRKQPEKLEAVALADYNCLFLNGRLAGYEDKVGQRSVMVKDIDELLPAAEWAETGSAESIAAECLAVYNSQ
jgi:hypothetical protein